MLLDYDASLSHQVLAMLAWILGAQHLEGHTFPTPLRVDITEISSANISISDVDGTLLKWHLSFAIPYEMAQDCIYKSSVQTLT